MELLLKNQLNLDLEFLDFIVPAGKKEKMAQYFIIYKESSQFLLSTVS